MVSSLVQTGLLNDPANQFIEIYYQGVWYPLPLVPQSRITRSPMSPFSPAIQRGSSDKVIDQRLNVRVWDDWSGGFGQKRSKSDEGNNRYWYGTLDSRSGSLVLPPNEEDYGQIGATLTAPVYGFAARRSGDLLRSLLLFGPNVDGIWYRNPSTSVWTKHANTSGYAVYDIVSFRSALWAVGYKASTALRGFLTSTDGGITWSPSASILDVQGVTVLDTRLFTFKVSDRMLYASADGSTWTAVSEPFPLDLREEVRQLLTWTTPDGSQNTVYALTNYQVKVLEEEPGFWHDYATFDGVIDASNPRMHIWRRNNTAYVTFYSNSADNQSQVLALRGGIEDEVGPRKLGGTPEDHFFSTSHAFGNVHDLFTWGVGGNQTTVQGATWASKGRLMSMDELGQWHTIADGGKLGLVPGESFIVGGFYDNQRVYAVLANGRVYGFRVPDRKLHHPLKENTMYSIQRHNIVSSTDNGGLRNVWKVGAYFLIDAELEDGTHGTPLGSTIQLKYQADNGPWVTLPMLGSVSSRPLGLLLGLQTLNPDATIYPAIQLLPNGTQQLGVPYKDIRWELLAQKTLSGNTPVITEVSLYYTLWLEQFYSHQFQVDFTTERWEQYGDGGLMGMDRITAAALLDSMSRYKGYLKLRFGHGAAQTTVEATDMLVAYRVVANTGSKVAQVSVRDLTAITLPG